MNSHNEENKDNKNKDIFIEKGGLIVTLIDENEGRGHKFEFMDFVDYEDKLYAIFFPVSDETGESITDAAVMECTFIGSEPVFDTVNDKEIVSSVLLEFASRDIREENAGGDTDMENNK